VSSVNEWTFDFNNSSGVPFRAVIRVGPNQPHMNPTDETPTISFYDRRYHDTFPGSGGQFTGGNYYLTEFQGVEAEYPHGLDLNGGVASWKIDAASMTLVRRWINNVAQWLEV
jgi:hypothetical protein